MENSVIPASVIVTTKNESRAIGACLEALAGFDEIVVVDSASTDDTVKISEKYGARVESFVWNGRYPKKRQWCLDVLMLRHDWVFFVDADEVVTPDLHTEIAVLFEAAPPCGAGYFVEGLYVWNGKILRRGLRNAKIALLNRRRMEFPVVDDLDIPGMGEMEGHYQPVPKESGAEIGRLRAPLLHYACTDRAAWDARHEKYAIWEAKMNARRAWPKDPVPVREALKTLFRALPGRDVVSFLYGYVWKAGFWDGWAGFDFACARAGYYRAIARETRRVRKSQ